MDTVCRQKQNGNTLQEGASNTPDYLYAGSNDVDAVALYFADGSQMATNRLEAKLQSFGII